MLEGILRLQPILSLLLPDYHKVNRSYLLPTNMYASATVVPKAVGQVIREQTLWCFVLEAKTIFQPSVYQVLCHGDGKLTNIPGIPALELGLSRIWE